jgi:hypothetical protein
MGITIFQALGVMAEFFMVYVLVQFVREGRRGRATRRLSFLYRDIPPGNARARSQRKVIQITVPVEYTEEYRTGRRAS